MRGGLAGAVLPAFLRDGRQNQLELWTDTLTAPLSDSVRRHAEQGRGGPRFNTLPHLPSVALGLCCHMVSVHFALYDIVFGGEGNKYILWSARSSFLEIFLYRLTGLTSCLPTPVCKIAFEFMNTNVKSKIGF